MIEKDKISLRSDDVNKLLESVPRWISLCGTFIVLFLIVGLIGLAHLIKYPDTLNSRIYFSIINQANDESDNINNQAEDLLNVLKKDKKLQVESKLIAYISMSDVVIGKIKVGQVLNIKLDNYPNKEFGIINGVVTQIKFISEKNEYFITAVLSNNLTSSMHDNLKHLQSLPGQVEIMLNERSVLERIVSDANEF